VTVSHQITTPQQSVPTPIAAPPGVATLAVCAGQAFTTGRDATGRFAPTYRQLRLYVTVRGHWYRSDDPRDDFHNDTVCRGCGHHGHFDYILDYQPCTRTATAHDVVSALLRGSAVAR
jgi:hypothetical protein